MPYDCVRSPSIIRFPLLILIVPDFNKRFPLISKLYPFKSNVPDSGKFMSQSNVVSRCSFQPLILPENSIFLFKNSTSANCELSPSKDNF